LIAISPTTKIFSPRRPYQPADESSELLAHLPSSALEIDPSDL
jgi:hypothetical protein